MTAILRENVGQSAVLKLNRPSVRNALDTPTMRELGRCISDVIADAERRVIIITGTGDVAFSAGGDIAEMSRHVGLEADTAMAAWEDTLRIIETSPKPVIAAINGFALGGGTELAMTCHIRTACEGALLGQPEIALDHLPGAGGTQRLPRLIELGIAYEYLLTGDPIPAAEAHRLGLVNHVWPAADLLPRTLDLAARIAQHSPIAVRFTLEAVRLGLQGSLDTGLRLERALSNLVLESEEAQKGLQQFLQRKKQKS
ncbi:enoyl-CoA hydratase/isomerase family protein [Mesorhizobium sp. CO1-1-8]|uniref:enoyl-CoA hydratase/isomerase family protein n=1 Tax=Mesorhizobium sp. CO1-1-8 TaxID=2876631 RepID=UPI001CD11ECB|nr:enoyl-CoA hydratase/isomerase family protein [Mesorhizobium sp. CO1-1-8]MBZ9772386.1 enoyl-CoA hydratase/isomerase family protein [Mesorhizobium sp. CO1-1-8]